jgi:hypothetical protein
MAKADIKKQLEIFHKAGDYLGSKGIRVLVLTSLRNKTFISKSGFTFEDAIYLIKHLSKRHPQELKVALDVVKNYGHNWK